MSNEAESRAHRNSGDAVRVRDMLLEIVRWDFERVLSETGMSAEEVARMSCNLSDQTSLPAGFEHLRLDQSPIQGTGLFTQRAIRRGEVIGPARIAGKRTPLGRYANHSPWPNAEFIVLDSGDLNSVAVADIPVGGEILNNYRQGAAIWGATFEIKHVLETSVLRERMLLTLLLGSIPSVTDREGQSPQ